MKSILQTITSIIIIYISHYSNVIFANNEVGWKWSAKWLLDWVKDVWTKDNWKSASERIREWDLHLDDIPNVIQGLINIFIGLAWTIAVIFVIYWAYRLLFWSLKWDHTKWRETIVMALTGFVISILAWFIVKLIFNNLV